MSRSCHVYDYEGEHLGSFASWDAAHEWAHLQAVLTGVATPIEVEDRHHRVTRRVWADRCEQVHADERPGGHGVRHSLGLVSACADAAVSSFAPPLPRVPS